MKRITIVMLSTAFVALAGFGQEDDSLVVVPYGNVGIGIMNPQSRLHLHDPAHVWFTLTSDPDSGIWAFQQALKKCRMFLSHPRKFRN